MSGKNSVDLNNLQHPTFNLQLTQEKSALADALFSDPGGIRTPNQQNRNLSFYPVELRGRWGAKIAVAISRARNLPTFAGPFAERTPFT